MSKRMVRAGKGIGQIAAMWAVVALLGCGEVTIAEGGGDDAVSDATGGGNDATAADGATSSDGATGDTASDASAADATADGAGDAGADTGGGITVTGQGELSFETPGNAASYTKVVLRMFQTSAPPVGKVYVLWLVQADDSRKFGAVLPYEDIPYKADFTVSVASAAAGADPLLTTVGGEVTLEDEVGAGKLTAPKGKVLYNGGLPKPAWVHVVHTLAAKPEGGKGYLQDADAIVANVDGHREAAKAAFIGGKPKDAVKEAEAAHNALVGKAAAVDLDGDGFKTHDAPMAGGLKAPETSLHHAAKHIGFAKNAAPELGKGSNLFVGGGLLDGAVTAFDGALNKALPELEAFAKGTNKDFKAADDAMGALRKSMNDAIAAGRKIATYTLTPAP